MTSRKCETYCGITVFDRVFSQVGAAFGRKMLFCGQFRNQSNVTGIRNGLTARDRLRHAKLTCDLDNFWYAKAGIGKAAAVSFKTPKTGGAAHKNRVI